ncbi:hypothetical protein [Streptomyces hydrogenans]|uniref:hypothetical protein n=1 Tax=Streptomyces hydrogenans TaxID=1873719 RepID=UPI003804E256
MAEYMIRTVSGDDWPVIRADLSTVIQPRSFDCEVIVDEDVLSFRTGGTTVTASWELLGTWYVEVEGAVSLDAADAIVAEMTQQLGEAAGQAADFFRVTD